MIFICPNNFVTDNKNNGRKIRFSGFKEKIDKILWHLIGAWHICVGLFIHAIKVKFELAYVHTAAYNITRCRR